MLSVPIKSDRVRKRDKPGPPPSLEEPPSLELGTMKKKPRLLSTVDGGCSERKTVKRDRKEPRKFKDFIRFNDID